MIRSQPQSYSKTDTLWPDPYMTGEFSRSSSNSVRFSLPAAATFLGPRAATEATKPCQAKRMHRTLQRRASDEWSLMKQVVCRGTVTQHRGPAWEPDGIGRCTLRRLIPSVEEGRKTSQSSGQPFRADSLGLNRLLRGLPERIAHVFNAAKMFTYLVGQRPHPGA